MSPIIDLKHVLIFIKMNSLKGNILQSRTFIKTFQYNDKKCLIFSICLNTSSTSPLRNTEGLQHQHLQRNVMAKKHSILISFKTGRQ